MKGLTFEEISWRTGEPLREVQFDFPQADVHLLQRLPGMVDFSCQVELLNYLKSIWGLKDAPRAFGMARDDSLLKAGFKRTTADRHVWANFCAVGKSVCVVTTHVDDVKGRATKGARAELRKRVSHDFGGELNSQEREFERAGIQHSQNSDTREVYVHETITSNSSRVTLPMILHLSHLVR